MGRKGIEFLTVSANLAPTIVIPNGWTKGAGAGTPPVDAAMTKAQRDVSRRGCWFLTLVPNPSEPQSRLFS